MHTCSQHLKNEEVRETEKKKRRANKTKNEKLLLLLVIAGKTDHIPMRRVVVGRKGRTQEETSLFFFVFKTF